MYLPSMNALRAFEAAARLGSVSKAAAELNLTRSAISHQLRFLESELGTKLVKREGRGIALTPAGRRYARQIQRAFSLLREPPSAAGTTSLTGTLRVACVSGFCTYWLSRHIDDFHRLHPDLQLEVIRPAHLADVTSGAAHIYIVFGHGDWPGRWVELVAALDFFPVCSPSLLNKAGGLSSPDDLARCTLLHLIDPTDWRRWLGAARTRSVDPDSGIYFSDIHFVISATLAGQGVAMGDDLICAQALRQGQLIRPFAFNISGTGSYYFVAEHDVVEQPAVAAFRIWLKEKLSEDLGISIPRNTEIASEHGGGGQIR
jgi:LysR family transcriptional regulator, glycine cleavage system transcriptional activator